VRCSVLQCVAHAEQGVGNGSTVLQCVAVCCSILQFVAHGEQSRWQRQHSVVQCVVVCCIVLHTNKVVGEGSTVLQCVAVHYSVLQCVAPEEQDRWQRQHRV